MSDWSSTSNTVIQATSNGVRCALLSIDGKYQHELVP